MGTAATAKRPIKATKRPSGGGAKSAAHLGVERKKNIICAPTASLSEKRRVAALISWEKRRINAEKRANKAASSKSAPKTSSSSASKKNKKSNAAPTAQRLQKANAKKTTDMFRSKNSVVLKANKSKPRGKKNLSTKSLTSIRREAARLGWERRKNMLAGESSAGSSTSDASSGDEGSSSTTSSTTSKKKKKPGINYSASARRQAAILGWQKRNSAKAKVPKSKKQDNNYPEDPSEARRRAAKLGWERRAKRLAAESSSAASSDASSGEDDERSSGDETSATRKIHDRRQAAILGWQRRKNERESATRDSTSSLTSDDIMSIVTTAAPKEKPRKAPPQRKETKQYREGTKRSRRLAEDPAETLTYEEEAKKINELVTYLRVTRGWMEFQLSSRHGSGTATHGYIPSSLATYIRDGTINQSTVLGFGTLGIHYALDWEGYGGLRDMIATFGEDYSPYPTEEMMEQSRVPEWELGEDLPWREVEEAEETKLNEAVSAKEKEMTKLIGLATILANMDHDAVVEEAEQEKLEQEKQLEQERLEEKEQARKKEDEDADRESTLPLLALKSCESSNNNSSNEDNSANNNEDNNKDGVPLKTPVKKDDDILIISKNVNNRSPWNFGLC